MQVWNLTMGMLGAQEKPMLHCKAAEARGLLEFVTVILDRYKHQFASGKSQLHRDQHKLEGNFLLGAAQAASNFERILQDTKQTRRLDLNAQQQLMFQYHRFVVLFHRIEGTNYMPKTHLMYHLIKQSKMHGHPLYYHTYSSESMNGAIAKIARSCHRTWWAAAVFRKFQITKFVPRTSA
jgi:hypothetical protein